MKKHILALIAATCFLFGGISCLVSVIVKNDGWSLFFGLTNFVLYTMSMKVAIDDKD